MLAEYPGSGIQFRMEDREMDRLVEVEFGDDFWEELRVKVQGNFVLMEDAYGGTAIMAANSLTH